MKPGEKLKNRPQSIAKAQKNITAGRSVQAENSPRRALLKSLLLGGAVVSSAELPKNWVRPVVDSVLLPAHAQTSGVLEFSVKIRNLTGGQPFSPPAVIAHGGSYSVGSVGSFASAALEQLAEGGDPGGVVSGASANPGVYQAKALGGPVGPGGSASTSLSFPASNDIRVTVVAMLVVTNDGIARASLSGLSNLNVGQSASVSANAYDAGTEMNDELMANIPGTGGEGFNPANTNQAIAEHSTIQGIGDLPGGADWSGKVISVAVTRIA